MQNKLTTPEELQERVSALSERIDTLKSSMRGKSERMKELDELLRMVQFYTKGKPVADKLATIKWKGKREQFMSENENALRLYHMAERKLKPHFKDGKLPITAWRKERDRLEQEYKTGQAELSPIHAEVKKLWQIKYKVEQVIHEQERQNAAIAKERKSQVGTGDRSGKIRTYNFPQNRVTDHRLTGDNKNFNIAAIMNGDLDPLIDALTLNQQAQRLQEGAE